MEPVCMAGSPLSLMCLLTHPRGGRDADEKPRNLFTRQDDHLAEARHADNPSFSAVTSCSIIHDAEEPIVL